MENEDLTGKISAAKQLYAVQSYEECSSLIQVSLKVIINKLKTIMQFSFCTKFRKIKMSSKLTLQTWPFECFVAFERFFGLIFRGIGTKFCNKFHLIFAKSFFYFLVAIRHFFHICKTEKWRISQLILSSLYGVS